MDKGGGEMIDDAKKVDDGGSAFPDIRNAIDWKYQPGMTLRDYFAGMALQGIIAHVDKSVTVEVISDYAYYQADAMIERRKR